MSFSLYKKGLCSSNSFEGVVTYDSNLINWCNDTIYNCKVNIINLCSHFFNGGFTNNSSLAIPKGFKFKDYLCNLSNFDAAGSVGISPTYEWVFIPRIPDISPIYHLLVAEHAQHLILLLFLFFFFQKVGNLSVLMLLALFFNLVNAFNIPPIGKDLISMTRLYWTIVGICTPSYQGLGWFFDYKSCSMTIRKTFSPSIRHKTELGVIYLFQIHFGIFFTNAIWYLSQNALGNILPAVIYSISSVVAAAVWYILRVPSANPRYDFINSGIRQLSETYLFLSVCLSTYGTWNLFINAIHNKMVAYLIGSVLGLAVHILSGCVVIALEFLHGSPTLYGALFLVWWTSAIFHANSLVELFIGRVSFASYGYIWIPTIIVSFIIVLFTYPEYYLIYMGLNATTFIDVELETVNQDPPMSNNNRPYTRRVLLLLAVRVYFCILSYCFSGGLLWNIFMMLFG